MNRFRIRTRAALVTLGLAAGLIALPATAATATDASGKGVSADTAPQAFASALPGGFMPSAARPFAPHAPAAQAPVEHAPCTGEFRGDTRLGPRWLPKDHGSVGPLLKGYHRTGGLGSVAFLKKYWQGPADSGTWKYPPNDGFAEVNGDLDKRRTELRAGEELDRFGSEYGAYLAPAGDRYEKRALPPQSLNTFDSAIPCNYHIYRVTKPFPVWQGSIAPWFGQPGHGQQIMLDKALLAPGAGQQLNVKWLLDKGYLAPAGG